MNVSVNKNVLNVTIGETSLKLLTSAVVNIGGGDADTLNGADGAYYLDRDNHTGTQAISTIDGLQNALDLKLDAADYNDRFLGLYASLFDLQAAHPTASAGDYAQVDLGIGTDVIVYAWDVNDAKWAAVGSSAIANTDALPEGSSSLYHTSQRVRDTALSGLSLLSSLAITAADSVLSAFGKLQAQISALATVARTGSYNDLSDKPAISVRDGFDYYAYIGDRWLNPNITNQIDTPIAPWGQLHNAAIIPAANNTSLMYALLEFDLCAFPTAAADGYLVVLINGAIVNSTISNSFGNTNYFARIQLEVFRRTGGSIGYLVRSGIVGTPLFRGLYAPGTAVPFGIDLPIELRFRPIGYNTVEHISTTNCALAVKRVQNGV